MLIGHSSGCKNILNILPDVKHKVSHVCFLAPALDLVQASNDIIKLGQKILAKSKPSVAKEIESIEADLTDSFDELKERALMLAFSSNYVVRNFDSEASFNNYFSYLTGKFEFCVDTYIKVNRSMPLSVTKSDEVFDIPLLAILGAKDPVFGVQDSKSLISKYFTNKSILVYENTSHYPHIDEKEEFLKVLRSFLF